MKKFAGALLLLIVVVVFFLLMRGKGGQMNNAAPGTPGAGTAPLTLKGFVGGEKLNFLKDPDVVKILQERYGLTLEFDKRGSLEMAEDPQATQKDFLWPSSQVALEIYKDTKRPMLEADIVFNSPMILYSWGSVTDALVKQGVVKKEHNSYYVVDFPRLIKMVNEGKPWKDVGLPQLYGKITIFSTDPTKSNSGNTFAGLLATVLDGDQIFNEASIKRVLPTVKRFFDSQGFMEQSSEDIFRQFLNKGMGDKPIIVGYEAQLLEYSVTQGAQLSQRKEPVRMLYPKPTVWSSHPLIAINANGKRLITALQDKDILSLAWKKHGFRIPDVENASKAFAFEGVPDTIDNVVPMPNPRIMKMLLQSLSAP